MAVGYLARDSADRGPQSFVSPTGCGFLRRVTHRFFVPAVNDVNFKIANSKHAAVVVVFLLVEKKRVSLECTVWANSLNSLLVLYVGCFLLMTSGRHRGSVNSRRDSVKGPRPYLSFFNRRVLRD